MPKEDESEVWRGFCHATHTLLMHLLASLVT